MTISSARFEFRERSGPYAVGIRVVEQYDASRVFRPLLDEFGRSFAGERSRPLQTLIWYPAMEGGASPMRVLDYLALCNSETSFGESRIWVRFAEWQSAMAAALQMPLWARRDAPEAKGSFPIVVYAPSFSSVSWENADLCEYWASHGFMVLATPSLGAVSRAMTTDLSGLESQARDISFLIGYARQFPQADLSNVAVAGFSWGGLSNVFAAARDNRIRALIALDGSLRYWPGLVRRGGVRADHMTVPLLSIAKSPWTLEELARYLTVEQLDGPNVLNCWTHADVMSVTMLGMTHRQFSSMFQRNEEFCKDSEDPEFPDRPKGDYAREDGIASYAWMARYSLEFLNAYLRKSPTASEFLRRSPAANGVPKYFMDVEFRPGRGVSPSIDSLRTEVGRRGFAAVETIYQEIRSAAPDFEPPEAALEAWAMELLEVGAMLEAQAVLTLNVRVHPDSSYAHGSLGRALELSGLKDDALEEYRTALAKDPVNAEARSRLRKLADAKSGGR